MCRGLEGLGPRPIRLGYSFSVPLPPINQWQFTDSRGVVYPWFTDGCLRHLEGLDIASWSVFEWGSGYGSLWWATRCRNVVSVEHDEPWSREVRSEAAARGLGNAHFLLRSHEAQVDSAADRPDEPYCRAIDEAEGPYDCIVIDGAWRLGCARRALGHLRPGMTVILDNSERPELRTIFELFAAHESHTWPQSGHPHWTTTMWKIRDLSGVPSDSWEASQLQLARRQSEGPRLPGN